MTRLLNLSLFAVIVSGVLSLALVRAAVADVASQDVPDGLRAAIQAEVEGRGHEYAGLCKDVVDDGQSIGKYCSTVLDLGADSAEVRFAPYATDGRGVHLTFALLGGVWAVQGEVPTPTTSPAKEWKIEDLKTEGSTVTLTLRVFAGIDVGALLDGREPDETVVDLPNLKFVFRDVSEGKHEVAVKDVVGFEETIMVELLDGNGSAGSTASADLPDGLLDAIETEIERRGYEFVGLCKEVVDDGTVVEKHCANVWNVTPDSADVAFAPYATDQLTTVRMVLEDGTWKLSAPSAPETGSGLEAFGSARGLLSNLAFASAIALVLGAAWMLGRADRRTRSHR